MTCSPPSSSTSSFSFLHRTSYSPFVARYASRSSARCEPSATGPVSAATARIDSTSTMFLHAPTSALAAADAFSIALIASSEISGSGMHAGFSWIWSCSRGGRPVFLSRSAGASVCMIFFFAKKPELPPSRMSVPRPAMLVAIVIANARPACAMISLSRATFSGFAFSTSCGTWSCSRSLSRFSEAWTLVVPMRMGWPLVWRRAMSPITAFHLPCCVRKVTSSLSRRATGSAVGIETTLSP
mmetsp:Transcript_47357/g.112163  ORF Transcript_47357/g.112163 Transcript_47357/m.112163 type:complete len:241 (-) Transcript_47357:1444-2166(-)